MSSIKKVLTSRQIAEIRSSYPLLCYFAPFMAGLAGIYSLIIPLLCLYRFAIARGTLIAFLAGLVTGMPILKVTLLSEDETYLANTVSLPRYSNAGEVRVSLKIIGSFRDRQFSQFWYPIFRECSAVDLPWRNSALIKEGESFIFRVAADYGDPYLCRIKTVALVSQKQSNILDNIRQTLLATTFKLTNDSPGSRLFLSMLFGIRDLLTKELEICFRKIGISHLLVLSGYQITLLFSLIVRRQNKILTVLGFVLTSFLLFISGWENSGLRAWLALFVSVAATLLERRNNLLNIIFVSLFLLCVLDPEALFEPSTHLTIAALLGIWFGIIQSKGQGKVLGYFYINLFCFITTGIVAALWFGTFPLFGVFVNFLLAVPLSLLTVPAGLFAYLVYILRIDSDALLLNLIVTILNQFATLVETYSSSSWLMLTLTPLTKVVVVVALVAAIICFVSTRNAAAMKIAGSKKTASLIN